jgi:hypothetical protein
MHAQRMIQVFAALLLTVSVCCAQQSYPEPHSFSFTQVDLELLDKSNQLDKQFQEKGLVYNDPETAKYLARVGQGVLPGGGPNTKAFIGNFLSYVIPHPTPLPCPMGPFTCIRVYSPCSKTRRSSPEYWRMKKRMS